MNNLVKNPFFKREVRRGLGLSPVGDTTTWAQVSAVLVLLLFFLGPQVTFVLAMILFAIGLTWTVVLTAGSTYASERDASTHELTALVPFPAVGETLGRWAGALAPIVQPWVLSVLAVPLAVLLSFVPTNPTGFVLMWLFFGLWLAGVAAFTLFLACLVPRRESVGSVVAGLVILLPLAALWLDPDGRLGHVLPLSMGTLVLLCRVTFAREVADGPVVAWAALLWTVFTPCMLAATTALVAARVPHLGLASRRGATAAPRRVSHRRPWFHMPAALGGDSPMYRAWLGAGRIDVWMALAGALVTVFVCAGLFGVGRFLNEGLGNDFNLADSAAVGMMMACLGYLVLGCSFGSAAYSHERQGTTWPLLVVSGLRPAQIVGGIFARCMHGLAWTCVLPLPFWLVVGLHAPALSLLGVLPPLALAVGVLGGIASAASNRPSEPRPFATSILIALGSLFCIPFVIGLFCLVLTELPEVSPYSQVESLLMAHGRRPLQGLNLLVCQVGLALFLLRLFWARALGKTTEIMA